MGIPSFYKHLIQTITGLVSKTHVPPELFGLDLNCAIYHCVQKIQKRWPYAEEQRTQWEERLIESVLAYIQQMTDIVKPTGNIYVAVDGVAPMAKIKQQRARRFKSQREAETLARITAEAKNISYYPEPRWDTTAITPGTQFMEKLAYALRKFARTHPRYIVSPADEPGEGEQKIMEYIRNHKPSSTVVYGLDADLIVLSLLTAQMTKTQVDLFREETEMNGSIKTNQVDEEQFLYLNTAQLATILYKKYSRPNQSLEQFIYDFVGLISLLGNDFVPHGLSLKIRDDGIPILMSLYGEVKKQLVDSRTWSYNHEVLQELFLVLNSKEERLILKAIKHKLEARVGNSASKEPAGQAIARYNDTPVEWGVERALIQYQRTADSEKPIMILRNDWASKYDSMVYSRASSDIVSELYVQSICWTLMYYTGQLVDTWFYYPWYLPPRAHTIVEWLKAHTISPPTTKRPPLHPQHQLAMVLPVESYHLLPSTFADIPSKYPHVFPTDWAMYSLGRRFMWECEPLIPLIQPFHMAQWVPL